jgi:predicted nuclease of predicted toxin-antitoxin system
VKFYFDEDSVQHRLVATLRSHSLDVVTSLDVGMNARDDESHLILAAAENRILVSANTCDFTALHHAWIEHGRLHSGILIIPQQRYSTGEIVRRMVRLDASGFDFASGIYFLSNF